jgi:chromate reductase
MPETLTFAVLVGSLRGGSYNASVARALPGLAPEGVTIAPLASIGGLPFYDADVQAAGFPPTVVAMGEAIERADGLVIVTPEYNYSIPGALKNAIDWLSRLPSKPLVAKPIALQSASIGMFGGLRSQLHLRQSLLFLNARVLGKPEVTIAQAQTKIDAETGALTDVATRDFLAAQLKVFAEFVRREGRG